MKIKRIQTMALMILVVGFLVMVSSPRLWAATMYNGSMSLSVDDPGEVFVTGQNNIIILRNASYEGWFDETPEPGDLEGYVTLFIDGTSNLFVGVGTVNGSFLFDIEGELSGTFEGRLVGQVTSNILSAEFVGRGRSGDFAGMFIKGTLNGPMSELNFTYTTEIR